LESPAAQMRGAGGTDSAIGTQHIAKRWTSVTRLWPPRTKGRKGGKGLGGGTRDKSAVASL